MRKRLFCLLPLIALALGTPARCAFPASDPASGQADTSGTGQPGDISPNAPPSDWTPPYELLPGQYQDLENNARTDGTSPLPTFEMRSTPDTPADSTEIDPVTGAQLAPRVDVAGPGTPKWKVITYVGQKTTADSNIFIAHSNRQSDVYFSISPGFAVGWGDYRTALLHNSTGFSDPYQETREPVEDSGGADFAFFNYTATATHFVSHDSQDAVNQDGAMTVLWALPKLTLGLSGRVQTLTGPDIDVGTRTRRTVFTLDATANYAISDKTAFNFEAVGSIHDYVSELSSSDWHGQMFVDYQWFPKTDVGAGVVAGVRTLENSPDQYYQQAVVRATYTATERLSVHVDGGLEIDDASGGNATELNPIFGLGAKYTIDEANTVSLDASRATSSSPVITGEDEETTSVDLEVRHRIFAGLSFAVSAGYTHGDFYTNGLSTLVRTDNYVFLRPSLACSIAQWSQVEVAYEYHHDASNQKPYDFGENIASIAFNFVF